MRQMAAAAAAAAAVAAAATNTAVATTGSVRTVGAAGSADGPDARHAVVLGMGAAGVDTLAAVQQFPERNAKVRVLQRTQAGGGNAANTLSALSRLGLPCAGAFKVGADSEGDAILDSLQREQVDTALCVRQEGVRSPSTWVIIDEEFHSRTCLHTPISKDLSFEELDKARSVLASTVLLHSDTRMGAATVPLAREAVLQHGVLLSLDVEKERDEHVRELLELADIVVTNSRYPRVLLEHTGIRDEGASILDGMRAVLARAPRAELLATTLGSEGALLMFRPGALQRLQRRCHLVPGLQPLPALARTVAPDSGPKERGLVRVRVAEDGIDGFVLMYISAWPLERDAVVDTTGAGDAFIAGLLYSVLTSEPRTAAEAEDMVDLLVTASAVASLSLRGTGSRAALPSLSDLRAFLSADRCALQIDKLAQLDTDALIAAIGVANAEE